MRARHIEMPPKYKISRPLLGISKNYGARITRTHRQRTLLYDQFAIVFFILCARSITFELSDAARPGNIRAMSASPFNASSSKDPIVNTAELYLP
jgi:hypothetical protein